MDSQNKQILRHLELYGSITPKEADRLYRCMRLAARIADLRAVGVKIDTDYQKGENGSRYAEYRIVKGAENE